MRAQYAIAAGIILCSKPLFAGTPFPLGAFLGNPNGSNATAEAAFEAAYSSFSSAAKAHPALIDSYLDNTQPVSSWPSNASWQAWSNAVSPDAKSMTPVLGFPLSSTASGASSDQQYQAFASGQYDSDIAGVVDAWSGQGFSTMFVRIGWEMNIQGPNYAGGNSQIESDWIAAFRHVASVLRSRANTDHMTLRIVWNPNASNWAPVNALSSLYPGDASVDVVAADFYSDMYPYSDGNGLYHDWHTGGEDTSVAQFMADPVNRRHYWTYPAATKYSLNASEGHALTVPMLIHFAQKHGKMFAIAETGAGDCSAGTDVCDDPTFPFWLAGQLANAQAGGSPVAFVNVWDSNAGGYYEFSFASDGKPKEAAAWGLALGSR